MRLSYESWPPSRVSRCAGPWVMPINARSAGRTSVTNFRGRRLVSRGSSAVVRARRSGQARRRVRLRPLPTRRPGETTCDPATMVGSFSTSTAASDLFGASSAVSYRTWRFGSSRLTSAPTTPPRLGSESATKALSPNCAGRCGGTQYLPIPGAGSHARNRGGIDGSPRLACVDGVWGTGRSGSGPDCGSRR